MKVRLNLMPWRERQRLAALRRLRLMLLGSLCLALGAVLLMDQLVRERAQRQAADNRNRQAAIAALDAQLEQVAHVDQAHAAVRAQMVVLANLRVGQGAESALLADMERALPEGIQLTELKLEGSQLRLVGVAASGAVVAQFMRELERSSVLLDLELERLRSTAGGDEFLLVARMSAGWS
ncbi:PilN domain-containing protein [Pseudomonas plecoglossicida]|uniref:PilN domain-containing protein n=1 Tax=Pseudomonas plecoglossicida TaxID=70775 RepID=UPI003D1A49CB